MEEHAAYRLPRAWYSAPVDTFLSHSTEEVIGHLTRNSALSIDTTQRDAWTTTIQILKSSLQGHAGHILLEFNIPRMGARADAALLIGGCLVILEFKVGERTANRDAFNQVWEYALDTKNFHEPSHSLPIIPVLIPTEYRAASLLRREYAEDWVSRPLTINPHDLSLLIGELATEHPTPIDINDWLTGRYKPTPTIIEAARHLYAHHSVADIVRTEADATNLSHTSRRIESLIQRARTRNEKIIIFVTGVPGAGKTLVGLNLSASHRGKDDSHAVFLSGNGPLVAVLREALTRDDVARRRQEGKRVTKKEASKPVKAIIQNVHHFRDEYLRDRDKPPSDRIVIFDEAQRAWSREKAERWMRVRKGFSDFRKSEPEFLIECMDRHQGWAVIVCLVGGGQEIGDGEAGIGSWVNACIDHFPHWTLCISNRLTDAEYDAGEPIRRAATRARTEFLNDLHLTVSMRSFRAENVSAFVKALLDCKETDARIHFESLRDRYPIVVTRELETAKQWVRAKARAHERFGLLSSSKAMRLKPHAIDVRVKADPVIYFLGGRDDVRSSYYMEDCATEFQVQGLELDWTVVTWDADLRKTRSDWSFHDFRGSRWQNVRKAEEQRNLKNAYRVLMTRARQGMAIFVPRGAEDDPTRPPAYYDTTYEYLRRAGIPEI
jgi:hypothetical protein